MSKRIEDDARLSSRWLMEAARNGNDTRTLERRFLEDLDDAVQRMIEDGRW